MRLFVEHFREIRSRSVPLPLKIIFADFDNRNWHASNSITLTKVLNWTRRCNTILIFVGDILRGTTHNDNNGNSLSHIWSALASIRQFDASLVRKNFYFNFSPMTVAFYQQQDVFKCDKIPLQFWSLTSIKAAATLIKSAVKLKQHERWVQNGREWHQWKMILLSLCRLSSYPQLLSSGCNR